MRNWVINSLWKERDQLSPILRLERSRESRVWFSIASHKLEFRNAIGKERIFWDLIHFKNILITKSEFLNFKILEWVRYPPGHQNQSKSIKHQELSARQQISRQVIIRNSEVIIQRASISQPQPALRPSKVNLTSLHHLQAIRVPPSPNLVTI